MYTAASARRECMELINEGYGLSALRCFLNDLTRSGYITWEENKEILIEIANGL